MSRKKPAFEVGIDSYALKPLSLSVFECLDWAAKNGADGVQFSEVNLPPGRALDGALLRDLSQDAKGKNLYLEWGGGQHIPFSLETGKPVDIASINRRAAEQAAALGAAAVRSCSGGLMRWRDDSPATEVFLEAMAKSLAGQRGMLEGLGVTLAIETHFEFTSFELLRLFEMTGARPGGFLGVCLDTMNLLTMIEEPLMATQRLLPWVVMTHVKDGGILLREEGLVTFPVAAGDGIVDFSAILGLLAGLDRPVRLSLEDHGGDFLLPVFDREFLARFPDVTPLELTRLLRLSLLTKKKMDAGKIARRRAQPLARGLRGARAPRPREHAADRRPQGRPGVSASVHERFRFRDRAGLEKRIGELGLDIPLADDLSPLFTPLAVGGKAVANRLVTLPMEGADADPAGAPTDLTFRRYRRFARGGCGLIWFEAAAVRPEGRGNPRQLMASERTAGSLARLVEETRRAAAERFGAGRPLLLILQLTHAGRFAKPEGRPSPVIAQHNPVLDSRMRLSADHALITDSSLDALREDYVRAASLAARAGFDGVDIKACHGYLVSELLAARARADSRYGGPFANRSRFLLETIQKIRVEAPGLLVGTRLNLYDAIPWPFGFGADPAGGDDEDLREPRELSRKLAAAGVSLIAATCGIPAYKSHYGRPFDTPVTGVELPAEHPLVGVARWLRITAAAQTAAPEIRVVGGGYSWLRHFFPPVAAAMVSSGRASLIGLGREAIAYPDWAADLESSGRLDPRRVCTACSKCSEMLRGGSRVGCAVRDAELYAPEYRRAREVARADRRLSRAKKED